MDAPPPGAQPGGFDVNRPILRPSRPRPWMPTSWSSARTTGTSPCVRPVLLLLVQGPRAGSAAFVASKPSSMIRGSCTMFSTKCRKAGRRKETSCGTNLSAAVCPGRRDSKLSSSLKVGVTDESRRYILEIHYNNSAGYDDVSDQSGIRIYHTAPEGPTIDMLTVEPDLPPPARSLLRSGYL